MNNIDLSILPPLAKQEMIDFYQFLLEKYTQDKKESSTNGINPVSRSFVLAPRLVKPFKPLAREECYER